jgi:signal peptidase I
MVGMYIVNGVTGVIGLQFARAYRGPTPAMYPTLEVGDYLLSSTVLRKPERGQIIVYLYPHDQTKAYIHRIIGLPGDTVEIRQGDLIVNGKEIERQRLRNPCTVSSTSGCTLWQESIDGNSYKIATMDAYTGDNPSRHFGPSTVPDGQLFVLGDNRDNSADSRYWGFVPIELVRANPRFLYWSVGEEGIRWDRITKTVE